MTRATGVLPCGCGFIGRVKQALMSKRTTTEITALLDAEAEKARGYPGYQPGRPDDLRKCPIGTWWWSDGTRRRKSWLTGFTPRGDPIVMGED